MGLQGRIVAVAFFAAVGAVYYLEVRVLVLWAAAQLRLEVGPPRLTGAGPVPLPAPPVPAAGRPLAWAVAPGAGPAGPGFATAVGILRARSVGES